MLRADLFLANIPWKDAAGRVFDFHSLCHQFITSLAKAGVHPRVAQQLAGTPPSSSRWRLTRTCRSPISARPSRMPEIPDATTGELDESPGRSPFS